MISLHVQFWLSMSHLQCRRCRRRRCCRMAVRIQHKFLSQTSKPSPSSTFSSSQRPTTSLPLFCSQRQRHELPIRLPAFISTPTVSSTASLAPLESKTRDRVTPFTAAPPSMLTPTPSLVLSRFLIEWRRVSRQQSSHLRTSSTRLTRIIASCAFSAGCRRTQRLHVTSSSALTVSCRNGSARRSLRFSTVDPGFKTRD